MEIFNNYQKPLWLKTGAACLVSLALSACLKDNSSNYNPPVALVTFAQASPDEPNLDFYLDNNRLGQNPILYGSTLSYFQAYAGKRHVNFYVNGSMSTVFSDTVTFKQNYVYSLFLANKASTPELILLTDSISQPAQNTARIRFINLSPDAPAVDLAIKGGTLIASGKSFKQYTSFVPVTAGNTLNFEVRQTGTNVVLATIPSANIIGGSVYTFWLRGLANPANNKDGLTLDVMTNATY